jgi:branched-chain amino acid transport system permease protein
LATYLILTKFGIPFWLLPPGCSLVSPSPLVVGGPVSNSGCVNLFCVVTLAFSELARLVVLNWNSVTNGTLGILVLDKPTLWLPGASVVKIEGTQAWYLLTLTSLIVVATFSQVLVRSWVGRNFAAIRLNEDLAQTLGINTFRYKLLAFTVSNILAAFAGVLFGFYTNYIEPSQLSITQSLDAIAMVLLGGLGSILGPVVGALLLTGLPHVIEFSAELRAAAYGAILILVILVMPRGIVGLFSRKRHVS